MYNKRRIYIITEKNYHIVKQKTFHYSIRLQRMLVYARHERNKIKQNNFSSNDEVCLAFTEFTLLAFTPRQNRVLLKRKFFQMHLSVAIPLHCLASTTSNCKTCKRPVFDFLVCREHRVQCFLVFSVLV